MTLDIKIPKKYIFARFDISFSIEKLVESTSYQNENIFKIMSCKDCYPPKE